MPFASISPTQSDIQAALRAFLLDVLPSGVSIVSAQGNRAPEPRDSTFCVMTPIRFTRLETNLDAYADVKFVAILQTTNMAVLSVESGTIEVGAYLFGIGIPIGTYIVDQVDGTPGGIGNYTVTPPQILGAVQTVSAGTMTMTQGAEVVVQLDFHSADLISAGAMAQTVSTMLRDEYGTSFFAALPNPQNNVAPLWADGPLQMPFLNAEQAYEWRWVLDARLQANQTMSVPQTFFDSAAVTLYTVEGNSVVIGNTKSSPLPYVQYTTEDDLAVYTEEDDVTAYTVERR